MPKQVWEVSFEWTDNIEDDMVFFKASEVKEMISDQFDASEIRKLKVTKKGAK